MASRQCHITPTAAARNLMKSASVQFHHAEKCLTLLAAEMSYWICLDMDLVSLGEVYGCEDDARVTDLLWTAVSHKHKIATRLRVTRATKPTEQSYAIG